MIEPIRQACVLGMWHLGCVVSACLADLGYRVVGVDSDLERVQKLRAGIPPIFEPGLEGLLQKNLAAGRLAYTADFGDGVRDAECVIFAYDTPVDANDELDLGPIVAAAQRIAHHLRQDTLVVVQSQLPVGTCEKLAQIMRQANPRAHPAIACVPENLRLGRAITRFMKPAMLIMGADEPSTLDRVDAFLSVVEGIRVRTNLRTAEMSKHALNAFFATCISFANEMGNLCDQLGADGIKVAEALRLDERIGPNALVSPGTPFGGGTLARDLRVLQALGKATGSETTLVDAVLRVNEQQKALVTKLLRQLFGELKGLTVGVLGLTYKAGTSTLRRSQALDVIRQLTAAGAVVKAYDPKADLSELGDARPCDICGTAYEAAEDADAVVIATDWPDFRELDFFKLRSLLRRPVILDIKNLLDPEVLADAGFVYLGIGRGATRRAQKA